MHPQAYNSIMHWTAISQIKVEQVTVCSSYLSFPQWFRSEGVLPTATILSNGRHERLASSIHDDNRDRAVHLRHHPPGKYRFNYGQKWHLERVRATMIRLPANKACTPDWPMMSEYIRRLPFSCCLTSN